MKVGKKGLTISYPSFTLTFLNLLCAPIFAPALYHLNLFSFDIFLGSTTRKYCQRSRVKITKLASTSFHHNSALTSSALILIVSICVPLSITYY
jgi:hypothetical protein